MSKELVKALNKDISQLHTDLFRLYTDNQYDNMSVELDFHDVIKDYQLLLPVINAYAGNANPVNLSKVEFNRGNFKQAIKKVEKGFI